MPPPQYPAELAKKVQLLMVNKFPYAWMPPPVPCTQHCTQKPGIYGLSHSMQHENGAHATIGSLSPMSHSIFSKHWPSITMPIQKLSTKGLVWQQAEHTSAQFPEKVLPMRVNESTLTNKPPPYFCTQHCTQKPGIYGPSHSMQHEHGAHDLIGSLSPV